MSLYNYNAKIVRVVDGDTVDFLVDLGFSFYVKQRFRLYGIDTPEVVGANRAAGLAAKAWLENKLPFDTTVMIYTIKDKKDKYGRYLVDIWLDKELSTINDQLVEAGHARRVDY